MSADWVYHWLEKEALQVTGGRGAALRAQERRRRANLSRGSAQAMESRARGLGPKAKRDAQRAGKQQRAERKTVRKDRRAAKKMEKVRKGTGREYLKERSKKRGSRALWKQHRATKEEISGTKDLAKGHRKQVKKQVKRQRAESRLRGRTVRGKLRNVRRVARRNPKATAALAIGSAGLGALGVSKAASTKEALHPAVWMAGVGAGMGALNAGTDRRLRGAALGAGVGLDGGILGAHLGSLPGRYARNVPAMGIGATLGAGAGATYGGLVGGMLSKKKTKKSKTASAGRYVPEAILAGLAGGTIGAIAAPENREGAGLVAGALGGMAGTAGGLALARRLAKSYPKGGLAKGFTGKTEKIHRGIKRRAARATRGEARTSLYKSMDPKLKSKSKGIMRMRHGENVLTQIIRSGGRAPIKKLRSRKALAEGTGMALGLGGGAVGAGALTHIGKDKTAQILREGLAKVAYLSALKEAAQDPHALADHQSRTRKTTGKRGIQDSRVELQARGASEKRVAGKEYLKKKRSTLVGKAQHAGQKAQAAAQGLGARIAKRIALRR